MSKSLINVVCLIVTLAAAVWLYVVAERFAKAPPGEYSAERPLGD